MAEKKTLADLRKEIKDLKELLEVAETTRDSLRLWKETIEAEIQRMVRKLDFSVLGSTLDTLDSVVSSIKKEREQARCHEVSLDNMNDRLSQYLPEYLGVKRDALQAKEVLAVLRKELMDVQKERREIDRICILLNLPVDLALSYMVKVTLIRERINKLKKSTYDKNTVDGMLVAIIE